MNVVGFANGCIIFLFSLSAKERYLIAFKHQLEIKQKFNGDLKILNTYNQEPALSSLDQAPGVNYW